jgi:uncharacterized Tic20 family protein
MTQSDIKTWSVLSHILTLAGGVIPFGNVIAPLVIWLLKKDECAEVARHALESLNFQISATIYIFVAGILCFVAVGFVLVPAVLLFVLVCVIVATVKAANGESFRYPLSLRFIR